ncbi:RAD55 family ATPase [Ferroplasma acidarmanus]|uniref:KaiC domain-containing protein n=1 Tax=Ferroplasma acidarmanus Fer1 TaxID=333146 RepID=S0ASS6_FERAC|nr:ATPase domain-containing protein [Ferroplasma acidarmanus]AGO61837.1 hypothetical protein FACI_IFERC00001G1861 [Ferroplasma acidarmanus Fer1]
MDITISKYKIKKIVSDVFDVTVNNIHKNYEIQGKIIPHKFDYVALNDVYIPIKIINEQDAVHDLMGFYAELEDCNIKNSIAITDRELNGDEQKVLKAYNIKAVDYRNYMGLDDRYSFGIHKIDMAISGGLRPGFVYLISGKTGSGKTTLSSIFLAEGAKNGEKGLIILTDTFPEAFVENIRTMDINFYESYKNDMIEIMEISDKTKSLKLENMKNKADYREFITKVISGLKKVIVANNIKRVVIDMVMPLLIPDDDYINLFINSLAMEGVVVIITSILKNSDLSVYGSEENYVAGIIKLDYKLSTKGIDRTMMIPKMPVPLNNTMPMHFAITSSGIEITSKVNYVVNQNKLKVTNQVNAVNNYTKKEEPVDEYAFFKSYK